MLPTPSSRTDMHSFSKTIMHVDHVIEETPLEVLFARCHVYTRQSKKVLQH